MNHCRGNGFGDATLTRAAGVSENIPGESARVLTDTELRQRSDHPPYIDLSGSDWQYPVYDLSGTWTKGQNEYVVRADGRAYRFSPAIYEFDHFYVVGKAVYPVTVGNLQSDNNWQHHILGARWA